VGFRDTLHHLLFQPPNPAEPTAAPEPPVPLEAVAGPPVALSRPVSQIPAPQGEVDLAELFGAAGIVSAGPFATAEKAMELRANFSALPQSTQVDSVEAALKTFGIAEPTIVADAVAKGEAIEAYLMATQTQTKESVEQIGAEIAALNEQIEAKKQALQDRTAFQDAVNRRCHEEMAKYADLIRFLASNDPRP
jgi:hypothetical protein